MKNTTAQKRLSKIQIENKEVFEIIKSIVFGNDHVGVTYSIYRSRPSIQFFKCNSQYSLFEALINVLSEIGFKLKSIINNKGFDIKILNLEYPL